MNRFAQAFRRRMRNRADHGRPIEAHPAPPHRSGWPTLTALAGRHRREIDAVPWHPDGPEDPWDRSSPYLWPWR